MKNTDVARFGEIQTISTKINISEHQKKLVRITLKLYSLCDLKASACCISFYTQK